MSKRKKDAAEGTAAQAGATQGGTATAPEQTNAPAEKKIKKFTIIGGILGLIIASAVYIVFPYEVLNWFMPNYQQLIAEWFPSAPEIIIDWSQLKPFFERWLYAGIPLAVIATITWACRKGGRLRLLMSTIYLAASIVWLIYVINFGDLSNLINITVDGQNYKFGIVLVSMLYLIILFKALKFLVIYGKYKDARKEYLGA